MARLSQRPTSEPSATRRFGGRMDERQATPDSDGGKPSAKRSATLDGSEGYAPPPPPAPGALWAAAKPSDSTPAPDSQASNASAGPSESSGSSGSDSSASDSWFDKPVSGAPTSAA